MKSRLLIAFLILSLSSNAQNSLYQKKVFTHSNHSLPYRIMYPLNYDKSKNYPLVLFLHGSGECGNDNEKQLVHGSSLFANAENRQKFPAIVVFPQCPENESWAPVNDVEGGLEFVNSKMPTEPMQLLLRLIRQLVKNEAVDTKRIYVGGLSMGGMGTFDLICRKPKMFAAAIPICGGVDINRLKNLNKMPVRIIHGDADNLVPVSYSVAAYDKLKANGSAKVEIVIFKGVGHNSWDSAFNMDDFLGWIFSKSL